MSLGKIHVRVVDGKKGLSEYSNITAVRLISDKYRLLVMAEYTPMIGRVKGSIVIVGETQEHKLDNVIAYYRISNNEVTLIIDEHKEK